MSEFEIDWRDLDYTPSVDRWFARSTRRGLDKPELTKSQYLPAKQMTAEEFASFQANGGKINYCFERADKQLINDERHEKRARQHPLFDIVVDVVAAWDCSEYLGRRRKVVRGILSLERNARRRKLEGLSTMARRHQQAIRLVHALAFDGLNAAEYCRRSGLDPADASRMLAHLYEKEPGLQDAIGTISACSTVISWKNRQQTRKFPKRERGLEIVYGFNYRDVADDGWLSDVPSTRFRSVVSGRFKPIAPKAYDPWPEPFRPLDLHEPSTWRKLRIPEFAHPHFWGALYEPMRAVERYDVPLRYGMFDRYRAISRKLRIKDHPETGKPRYRTWRIARAIPFDDRLVWALGHCPQHWYPVPNIWIGWDPMRARYERLDVDHGLVPIHIFGNDGRVIVRRLRRAELNPRPMCRPMHSGQVLVAIDRGILPDIELMWASYCRGTPSRKAHWVPRIVRQPNSALITPYSHRNWIPFPVKDRKHRLAIQLESGLRLYFVSSVTTDTASDPPAPEGGTLS